MNKVKYSVYGEKLYISLKIFCSVFISVLSLMFSACVVHDFSTEPENEYIRIKGSGILISEERDLPFFNSISMNTAGLVTISSGSEQYTEITVDDNVMKYLSVGVQNEVLIIETIGDVSLHDYELTVDVVMTDLKSLITNSAGSIIGLNTFEEEQIDLIINSAGSISLDLKANQLYSMINSAGSLLLSGQVTYHNSILSSAGNLSAFDLESDTTTILLNSAGNAHVTVSELLEVTINSVGCVYYKGHPQVIQNINSIGRVIDAN